MITCNINSYIIIETVNRSNFRQYIALWSGYIGWHSEFLLYSPFLVVGILVGVMSHVICGEHNGGYDELRSLCVILFRFPGNILYGEVRILGVIRSF